MDAFFAASRGGDFEALLAVLDPDVVFRADHVAVRMGGLPEIRGAAAVDEAFKGRAQAAKPALIDGAVGVAVILGGRLRIALNLTITGDRVVGIEGVADPERLSRFDLTVLKREAQAQTRRVEGASAVNPCYIRRIFADSRICTPLLWAA